MLNRFDFKDNNENIVFINVLDDIINDETENILTLKDMEINENLIKEHIYRLNKLKRIRNRIFFKTCKNFINNLCKRRK